MARVSSEKHQHVCFPWLISQVAGSLHEGQRWLDALPVSVFMMLSLFESDKFFQLTISSIVL